MTNDKRSAGSLSSIICHMSFVILLRASVRYSGELDVGRVGAGSLLA